MTKTKTKLIKPKQKKVIKQPTLRDRVAVYVKETKFNEHIIKATYPVDGVGAVPLAALMIQYNIDYDFLRSYGYNLRSKVAFPLYENSSTKNIEVPLSWFINDKQMLHELISNPTSPGYIYKVPYIDFAEEFITSHVQFGKIQTDWHRNKFFSNIRPANWYKLDPIHRMKELITLRDKYPNAF